MTSTTIRNYSGPESNGNDGVLHIPQRIGASTSAVLVPYRTLGEDGFNTSRSILQPQPTGLYFVCEI